jgi:hypothetical protein
MTGDDSSANPGKGGADHFVFHDFGPATVGTNNNIYDFHPGDKDRIEFIDVDGVNTFADLIFDTTTNPGNTIVHAGSDMVTLVGFTDSLSAKDFLIG